MKISASPLLGFALFGLAACGPVQDPPAPTQERLDQPRKIVSLNLCADQLLVALADRDQIAGLTRNADDAEMSAVADRVGGLTLLGNAAEQVLDLQPDMVVGMPASRSATLGALQDQHYRTLDLQFSRTLDDVYTAIRQTAVAVGHPDRGEAMVADMGRQLAQIGKAGNNRVAAYYQRRGFMTGTGTLIDDVMQRTGLVNLAARVGKPALAQLSLEEMVAARPDFIIMESATQTVTDQGSEMLHHAALRDIPRIYLPQAWTVCGGPAYVDAARSLVRQIKAHDDRHR